MGVDVCYIVSHGFASRMVTQTNLLGRIKDSGASVALISPDSSDPVLVDYCSKHGILLEQFRPSKGWFSEDYMFKRRYYLEDIRANTALWEKHLAATRFHPARNPIKRLRPYWYNLMRVLIPYFPEIRERFQRREERQLASPDAKELLQRLSPKRLVATYPVNLPEAILLHHAKAQPGIETWIHLLSWDNITCKGRFVETADQYIAWGGVMQSELQAHYAVPAERIHICGVPHFDLHQDERVPTWRELALEQLRIDASRRYIVFAMSSPRFAPNEIDIVEWIAAEIGRGSFGDLQMVVRPHPQNVEGNMANLTWLPRLRALEKLPGIAVSYPRMVSSGLPWSLQEDDMRELAGMLSGSAAVLNSGSTVSIDALCHGRPVLITSFDGGRQRDYWDSARRLLDYPHLEKLVRLGGVEVSKSYAELADLLSRVLSSAEDSRQAREGALVAECHSRDGLATERVVAALVRSLNVTEAQV